MSCVKARTDRLGSGEILQSGFAEAARLATSRARKRMTEGNGFIACSRTKCTVWLDKPGWIISGSLVGSGETGCSQILPAPASANPPLLNDNLTRVRLPLLLASPRLPAGPGCSHIDH